MYVRMGVEEKENFGGSRDDLRHVVRHAQPLDNSWMPTRGLFKRGLFGRGLSPGLKSLMTRERAVRPEKSMPKSFEREQSNGFFYCLSFLLC